MGEVSAAEKNAVEEWMNQDEANRRYYRQLQQIWDSSKQLAAVSEADENRAWKKFQQRVAKPKQTEAPAHSKRFSFLKIAASVLVAAGLAWTVYFITKKENDPRQLTAQTQLNVLTDTLSDGSVITLNKKSSITYPEKFKGKTRSVALRGEAFFQVAPNASRPFIILVNGVQVTVVGTSFNINSDSLKTEVIVETGIVRVTTNGKTTELGAGEKIVVTNKETPALKEAVRDKLYTYYRSKEFVCDDTPLWKLVEVLNEAYDTHIIIGRNELSNLRLNTTFNNESLDKILEIIHLTFDITVARQNGQIILQ